MQPVPIPLCLRGGDPTLKRAVKRGDGERTAPELQIRENAKCVSEESSESKSWVQIIRIVKPGTTASDETMRKLNLLIALC